jgi:hypothetical protein
MTDPFRLLVTASRDLTDRAQFCRAMETIAHHVGFHRLVVVHGACPTGGDLYAHHWALGAADVGVLEEPVPADWDLCAADCPPAGHRRPKRPGDTAHPGRGDDYCPGAGPRRNSAMVGRGADLCLAAPLGRSYGTRGCMRLAAAARIPVIEPQAVLRDGLSELAATLERRRTAARRTDAA